LLEGLLRPRANRRLLPFFAAAGLLLVLAAPPPPLIHAMAPGSPIYVGKESNQDVHMWDGDGNKVARFEADYDVGDELAVGDVNGDGGDEVVIANDVNHTIRIMDVAGIPINTFDSSFDTLDGFAVGDVNGDGAAEILVVGDFDGDLDIYDLNGNLLTSFHTAFDVDDKLATGDLDGDGDEEIIVVGNLFGHADIYDFAGNNTDDFDTSLDAFDRMAVGDVDGDGRDEIMVAGDFDGDIDVYDGTGGLQGSFDSAFDVADGFAAGDVDGDGEAEILVVGDVGGKLRIYNDGGGLEGTFDTNFGTGSGFAIGTTGYPDMDGDGLLDHWETNGLDADGDGDIDVDLPGFGADPMHKDLFLEFDWAPTDSSNNNAAQAPRRNTIQILKNTFAAAPIDAGGFDNPDGQPGINLWIDTGALADPTASEDGAGGNTCSDGIDNNSDGLTDGADPDCLVGDNLGGGNAIGGDADCLEGDFYDTKATNFNSNRALVFRYAIFGDPGDSSCNGGRGEIGGNDFIEFNHDAGTIMHELGHTLNLRHGGDENRNCKSNYVSVMNYDLQFGIPQVGSTNLILDYSPPRFNGGRGVAPLATLEENHLDETVIQDPSDPSNMFVFVDPDGTKVQSALNLNPDWDGDGSTTNTDVKSNLNDDGDAKSPPACDNSSSSNTLTGHDDWSVIAINFRPFGDSLDGALNPVDEPEMSLAEMLALQEAINTTDLRVTIDDTPDPATAGEALTYAVAVHNDGPNPANLTVVSLVLPAGTSHVSDDAGCAQPLPGQLHCALGALQATESAGFEVTVAVDADLVHLNGGPTIIEATATVANGNWPDADAADNTATAETLVVAVADLEMLGLAAVAPPAEMLIGETIEIELISVATSHGPSSPMDTRLVAEANAQAGASVSPASDTIDEQALEESEFRWTAWSFEVGCDEPGDHSFDFETTIAPLHPEDSDPDLSNNTQTTQVTIECIVPVALNIKPGSLTNPINPNAGGNIPTAVLTTNAGEYDLPYPFDATSIIATSVVFSPRETAWQFEGASEKHDKGHLEDALELDELTSDGDEDMVLHFKTQLSGIEVGETEACVKGEWTDDNADVFKFFGCDVLHTVPQ
jgi:uncharacterized repeat protein (TIGR01451 family)